MKKETLEQLLADLAAKRAAVLATPLSGGGERILHPFEAPAEPGAEPDPLLAAAREAATRDQSRTVDSPGGPVFLRVYNPPVRVAIIGAVHVAQALAPMIRQVGFDLLVIDPRRSFASAERFPGVALSTDWPDEALARFGLDRRAAVVTMTHDSKIDDVALAAALRSEAFYVGALGSKKTQAARRERMARLGFSESTVARIHGPVGLPLGAVSPGEIAVSILAELVQCLRQPQLQAARVGA
jgi:xanthine dehydrogenase accessory factor